MDTCIIASVRVHGLPATLTAFMTSIAVWVQADMTSAPAGVFTEIKARPTIADLRAFIVASFVGVCCRDYGRRSSLMCLGNGWPKSSPSIPPGPNFGYASRDILFISRQKMDNANVGDIEAMASLKL